MATTIPVSASGSLRKKTLLVGLVLIAGILAWFWRPVHAYARAGTAFGARVACSCRFVGGRHLSDCRKDFEPGMGLIVLSEDVATKTITARFPLIASDSATYRKGLGCQLFAWAG